MKKYISVLFVLLVLFFVKNAYAITEVHEVANSSATVVKVNVASYTATQMDSPSLSGRFTIEIWNDDTTDAIYCGFNVGVSSLTSSGLYGRKVAAQSSWVIAIGSNILPYCMGSKDAATTRAVVIQLK